MQQKREILDLNKYQKVTVFAVGVTLIFVVLKIEIAMIISTVIILLLMLHNIYISRKQGLKFAQIYVSLIGFLAFIVLVDSTITFYALEILGWGWEGEVNPMTSFLFLNLPLWLAIPSHLVSIFSVNLIWPTFLYTIEPKYKLLFLVSVIIFISFILFAIENNLGYLI